MRPDAGELVYGTIVVATLLAAESAESARRRAPAPGQKLVLQTLVGAVFGLLVIALRVLLH